nr:facilitated trehalose transporter Tret1-like [Onthophagus taurus]
MITDRAHLVSPTDPINATRNDGSSGYGTIEEIPQINIKPTRQYIATISATTSALASGIVLGWTSPITKELENGHFNNIPVNAHEMGWIGSIAVLGALLSSLIAGKICDKIGRKTTLLFLSIPFGVGWALILASQSIEVLILGRFLTGIAAGGSSISCPLYINEIAQKTIRGKLGSYFQIMVTVGVLYANVFGKILSINYYTMSCSIIPAIFLLVFLFQPETPVYYIKSNQYDMAVNAMRKLRGDQYDPHAELREIELSIPTTTISLYTYIFEMRRFAALSIAMLLMVFQQLSGINAVIFYTSDIFQSAHVNIDPQISAIIITTIQVLATFTSSLLIDKKGRKPMLIYSLIAMAASCLLLGVFFTLKTFNPKISNSIGFLPISSLSVYIIAFSLGMGPIPWIIPAELFQADIKGVATSIAGSLNWGLAFLITKFFLDVKDVVGEDVLFYFFGVMCFTGVAFVCFKLPETKGKTPEEIQREL